MDAVKDKLKTLRTKLDSIPVLQQAEVSITKALGQNSFYVWSGTFLRPPRFAFCDPSTMAAGMAFRDGTALSESSRDIERCYTVLCRLQT